MSCLPCGKITDNERVLVKYYQTLFEKTGEIYYVYRLSKGSSLNIIKKQYFNRILEEQIKPNFINGAEYFSIQEFKRN